MKIISILILSCFLYSSCIKREHFNEVETVEEKNNLFSQEIVTQENDNGEASYIFDIKSFKFLNEFPQTITSIKELYVNENFQEINSENDVKGLIDMGKYVYSLISPNIRFVLLGNSIDETKLLTVEIFNRDFQCRSMQVIGMTTDELIRISGEELTIDGIIRISTEFYVLSIKIKEDIVQSYVIITQL